MIVRQVSCMRCVGGFAEKAAPRCQINWTGSPEFQDQAVDRGQPSVEEGARIGAKVGPC